MKPKHWYDKTYKINFYIYYGWKEEFYRRHLLETFNVDKRNFGDGHTMINPEQSIITVWIRHKKNHAVVAHECLHAVNFVFNKVGVKASFQNDEAQAYYLERLFNEVING